ncbi:MAG: biotin/lipoyl-containing protein, partial [Candidatus Aminicenantales bacterium]
MAKEFRFPDVGEGITEGEIVRWLVKEGDQVQADQPLAEIETDKAIVEMPSPYAGTVLKLHFKEKDLVKVGQPLVTIGEKGESLAAGPPEPQPAVRPATPGAAPVPAPTGTAAAPGGPGEVLATPGVRALAKGLGVDLGAVRGTG